MSRQFKIMSELYTVRNNNVSSYLNEISSIPMLETQEEYEIAVKIKEGCEKSKEKLILSNLRFVVSVAKVYHKGNPVLNLEDLINDGNLGMIEAASLFDPSHGFKFISFAVWHIRRRIRESITKNSRHVKIPQNQIMTMNKIGRIQTDYLNKHDRFPDNHEIWEELQKLETKVPYTKQSIPNILRNLGSGTISLEGNGENQEDEFSPINYLEVDNDHSLVEDYDLNKLLSTLLKCLNSREIDMLTMRLGIGEYNEEHSNKQISHKYEITPESIRLINKKSIRKIQTNNNFFLKKLKELR
jgi:RNA polymerase primary sigma factor